MFRLNYSRRSGKSCQESSRSRESSSMPFSPSAEPLDVVVLPESEAVGNSPPALRPVRIYEAEPIVEQVAVVDERSLPFWLFHNLCSALEWLFGVFSMIVGLSILAVVPIAQLASLGYLLEVSGRIARTGKLS